MTGVKQSGAFGTCRGASSAAACDAPLAGESESRGRAGVDGSVAAEAIVERRNFPTLCLVALIRAYRLTLSPFFGMHCRFHPTCSAYALEAIKRFGAAHGGWLALRRIGRCHPWHPGGLDPVPERQAPR